MSAPSRYHVVYQVFVDRFARSSATAATPERAAEEGTVRRAFGATPDTPPLGLDLQGGDLVGLAGRVGHIQALADALYISPITQAPSNHKYDTSDFDRIDEHFGGEAGLAQLVTATRKAQLALFVDAVFNHVGERHAWVEAHAQWLRGSTWRGYGHLRELDLEHEEVRAALVGPGGIVEKLIRRGIDGLRLDCANDLGAVFCGLVAQAVARAGGRGGAIGEVMAWPLALLGDGALDGVMSYWPRAALLSALKDPAHIPAAIHALDRLCTEALASARYPALLRSWTILSSHDTPRVADIVGFDERQARLLFALQFAYPGTPMLYYGEEIGLSGGADPGCRGAMIWDEARWHRERLAWISRLSSLRRSVPALHHGSYVALPTATPCYAFARRLDHASATLVCIANLGDRPTVARVLLPLDGYYDALPLVDLLVADASARYAVKNGSVSVPLAPYGVCWLAPRDDHAGGYRFWKKPRLG